MLTPEEADEFFLKKDRPNLRWLFEPHYNNPIQSYRYGLTFIPAERRFSLSRQKIELFKPVGDEALLEAFRKTLTDEEIAACTREALKPKQPDDDIPF